MLFYCAIDDRRKISKFCFNSNIEGQQAGKHTYVCYVNKTNKWPVGRSKRKSRLRKSQRAANSKRGKKISVVHDFLKHLRQSDSSGYSVL